MTQSSDQPSSAEPEVAASRAGTSNPGAPRPAPAEDDRDAVTVMVPAGGGGTPVEAAAQAAVPAEPATPVEPAAQIDPATQAELAAPVEPAARVETAGEAVPVSRFPQAEVEAFDPVSAEAAGVLVDHPDNPIPPGASAGYVMTEDGIRLRWAVFRPATATPRGTVALFHGRAEFIERFFETVRDLQVRGFVVATVDWRGQGGSDRVIRNRRKGHVKHFSDYGTDLATFVEAVMIPQCPPPYFALGHSTAGLVLIQNAAEMKTRFRRYVLTAPFLGLGDYGVPPALVRPLAAVFRTLLLRRAYVPAGTSGAIHCKPFKDNRLTSDERRYERNARLSYDMPDLAIGSPTVGWLSEALAAQDEVNDPKFLAAYRMPTLIIAAGADEVVSTPASERFAHSTKAADLLLLRGAKHEILQEADIHREQFWAAFDAFVPGTP
ncbi:alpha/beta fold hydrolase [Methyloraptor flagellatus]|uniref:Alpha/beta fold hydrolase n=1 Tax=Methyloraptor flagellatus TaxID=3162530 RepID=A0AAU7XA62_9HYPH